MIRLGLMTTSRGSFTILGRFIYASLKKNF